MAERSRWRPARAVGVAFVVAGCQPAPHLTTVAAELMAADRAFAAATAERGAAGWAAFFAEDGLMYEPEGVVRGRAAILEARRPVFDDRGLVLQWEPDTAIVAASGELGYTLGRWEARSADGTPLGTGNYVSIWRRQVDGTWKVALDIGNRDPVPDDS